MYDSTTGCAKTAYRSHESVCVKRVLGLCIKHEDKEVIENNFDFSKEADVIRYNEIGFESVVRQRPE